MADAGGLRRELGLRDLVLFNIAAVAGIRWLAAAAHAGPGSVTLWVLAAACFFVPSATVVSGLTRLMPEEGGLYRWTRRAFGDWHGFLCGWCYWMNNLFYFPSLALAGTTMAVYVLGPAYVHLAEDRGYAISASLAVIWAVTLANVAGLNIAKWIGNIGGGSTYVAGGLLVALGAAAWMRYGSATPLDVVPEWNWERVNFWPQVAFAFGGLELGAILGGEIRDPARTVRRAAWISGSAITVFYIAGTVAMLTVLPAAEINVVSGLTQAGEALGQRFGVAWLSPLLAVLVTLGIGGQLGAWIGGTARLPMVLGMDRFLPAWLAAVHPRWRTPHRTLLLQAAACSAFLLAMQLGENLRTGYQLLVDMAVITYFIPFLYLFLAGWKWSSRWSAAPGLAVTVVAIAFSLVPPAGVASVWLFEAKLVGGTALVILLAWWWFRRRTGAA